MQRLGQTALHRAALRPFNSYALRLLLAMGADPNVKDGSGLTPVCWASLAGFVANARVLCSSTSSSALSSDTYVDQSQLPPPAQAEVDAARTQCVDTPHPAPSPAASLACPARAVADVALFLTCVGRVGAAVCVACQVHDRPASPAVTGACCVKPAVARRPLLLGSSAAMS